MRCLKPVACLFTMACLFLPGADVAAQEAGTKAPTLGEPIPVETDALGNPFADPVGDVLTERLNTLLPEGAEGWEVDAGWQRYLAQTTAADLRLAWRVMPAETADAFAQAVTSGRTLLFLHAEDERLLALSLLAFATPETANDFLTAAQTMSATQFAPPEALGPSDVAAGATSGDASDDESGVRAEAQYEDLKQQTVALDGINGVLETSVLMTVPGAKPAPTRILRAAQGAVVCEMLVVGDPQAAPVSGRTDRWFVQALSNLVLPEVVNDDDQTLDSE